MKNTFSFKTAALICCAVLIISFAVAASVFSGGGASGMTEVPENSYAEDKFAGRSDFSPEETETACALYIDGALAGYYKDKAAAEYAVESAGLSQLAELETPYISSEIISSVLYKTGEYPVTQIASASAVEFPRLTIAVTSYVTEHTVLEYAVEYRDDASQYAGREKVVVEGADGSSEDTYLVVTVDGIETSRTLIASNITAEPVNCVIERGIKAKKAVSNVTPIFIMPYEGGITSEYGTRYLMGNTFHKGVDISGVNNSSECYGKEIHAAGDGTVYFAGWQSGFGNLVIIEHANGIRTYYAHQKKVAVKAGDEVKQGDVIGYVGSSGRATGPHVHFEIRVPDENGKYYDVDPEPYIIDYDSYPRR